jgi:ligand-binding sensor domain-containing protein
VDPTNRIWIGTNSGLAVFDRSSWTIYTTSNSGLPHNNVKALAYEGNNIVWVGTPAGLAKYDGSWQNYIIGPSITNSVTTITVDQSNKKWLSVTDTGIGIVSFDGSTFTDYPIGEYNYFSKQVLCSSVDPSGNVWFGCSTFLGSGRGISKFNGSEFINIVISNAVLINHIYMSSEGIGWVSTDNGVYKITTSILRSYNTSNSPLKSNDIKGSVKDNEGNLWIATGSAGLAKYKGN